MTGSVDSAAEQGRSDPGYHLPWPDSDAPEAGEDGRGGGQVVISGVPSAGGMAFGRAARPYDLPSVPEPYE